MRKMSRYKNTAEFLFERANACLPRDNVCSFAICLLSYCYIMHACLIYHQQMDLRLLPYSINASACIYVLYVVFQLSSHSLPLCCYLIAQLS